MALNRLPHNRLKLCDSHDRLPAAVIFGFFTFTHDALWTPWSSPLIGRSIGPRACSHGARGRMVGRAGELNELMRTFDRMKQGRAQPVSLVGEAGRGKPRLLLWGGSKPMAN